MTGQGRVHWGLLGLFQESVEGSAPLEGSLEGLLEGSLGFIQGGYFRSPLGVRWGSVEESGLLKGLLEAECGECIRKSLEQFSRV